MKKWGMAVLAIMMIMPANRPAVCGKEKQAIKKTVQKDKKEKKKKVICIDAGHQLHADTSLEPNGPHSKVKKMKVTDGTVGRYTHVREASVNLAVALKLEKILKHRGYQVVMVRRHEKVNISNSKRAEIANKAHADAMIRLHCNDMGESHTHGFFVCTPSRHNKFMSKKLIDRSLQLSKCLLPAVEKQTHANNRGLSYRDDLTGTNFSKAPTALIEMGEMHNKQEDQLLVTASYQQKMALGLANGIDAFFH